MWQPGKTLDDLEKEAIISAYRFFGFNKTKTAQSLGRSIRTIDAKLAEYGLIPKQELFPEPEPVQPVGLKKSVSKK